MAAGMQIFNSSGRVVFDSSLTNKYARVVSNYAISVPSYHSGSGYVSGSYLAPGMTELVQSGHTPFFATAPDANYWNAFENMDLNLWMTNDGTFHWRIWRSHVSKVIYVTIGVI